MADDPYYHYYHYEDENLSLDLSPSSYCPCPAGADGSASAAAAARFLQDDGTGTAANSTSAGDDGSGDDSNKPLVVWEVVFSCIVLFCMFVALISDRLGADSVMITTLTAFMASGIISVQEGLVGFNNEGLLTVMVLLVVADGISKTGALDWYMAKLLGRPTVPAAAQLRLMIPIAVLSAFLNNVPIVAVMIPIVQKWSKNIKMSVQQLLIPLSYACILGGTCTLIGTSTNLVVAGLLADAYPNDPSLRIGLFDLGEYGFPVALAGMTYILLLSPFLLPGGARRVGGEGGGTSSTQTKPQVSRNTPLEQESEDLLMGARLTSWSPAAGRSVKRSGLRDTGGIYLVSVQRAITGNMHRAVSGEFILNVGDILWFTGLVETFGEFCNEHGLEIVTNEIEEENRGDPDGEPSSVSSGNNDTQHDIVSGLHLNGGDSDAEMNDSNQRVQTIMRRQASLPAVHEDMCMADTDGIPKEVGCTKESLLEADETERLRGITRMADLIHGFASTSQTPPPSVLSTQQDSTLRRAKSTPLRGADPANIVVAIDKDLVVVGINCPDRPGLLLDISKGLHRLSLQLKHTEAAVVDERSVSVWRCEAIAPEGERDIPIPDLEEIWSVLNALLSQDSGIQAVKQRGLRVIRARVTKDSRLINQTAAETDFKKQYRAAIVAVQSGGANISQGLSSVRFNEGDVLILQAQDDSALLKKPPEDFYKIRKGGLSRENSVGSVQSLVNLITRKKSNQSLDAFEGGEATSKEVDNDVVRSLDTDNEHITGTFFIPAGDKDDDAAAAAGDGLDEVNKDEEVAVLPIEEGLASEDDDEAIWRDLQVLFTGDDEDGDGNNVETVTREFLMAMQVSKNAKWAGKSARQVGLQKLPDLFLVSIERPLAKGAEDQRHSPRRTQPPDSSVSYQSYGENSEIASTVKTDTKSFTAIDQDQPLQEGDILWFSGVASVVGDLRKIPGLISYEDEEVQKMKEHVHDRRLVQAVIARNGPLVGKTVKETRFRTRYGAAVISVHRDGKRVHEHPGNVKLQAGDVLLLEAGPSFLAKTTQNDRSFALLAEVEDSAPPRLRLLIPAIILAVLMLAVYVAGLTSLLVSALCASVLMCAFGILSEQEARDALNWEVYVIIASAFGIGTALVNSGVAGGIANVLVAIGTGVGLGDAGLFGAIYFATFLISSVLTNNAAAALVFPIAMDAANQTGTDKILMSFCLMLGASASFMTPYGYTTNLLIYGPGGYKYTDFLYFGFPMQIVLWILTTAFLVLRPWYISWIGTGLVFFFVVVARFFAAPFYSLIGNLKGKIRGAPKPIEEDVPQVDAGK